MQLSGINWDIIVERKSIDMKGWPMDNGLRTVVIRVLSEEGTTFDSCII
jgi:hypothetical protein